MEEYSVAPAVLQDAKEMGFEGNIEARVKKMVRRSARITHDRGNRRYGDYVFSLGDDGVIQAIAWIDEEVAT